MVSLSCLVAFIAIVAYLLLGGAYRRESTWTLGSRLIVVKMLVTTRAESAAGLRNSIVLLLGRVAVLRAGTKIHWLSCSSSLLGFVFFMKAILLRMHRSPSRHSSSAVMLRPLVLGLLAQRTLRLLRTMTSQSFAGST
ncbi:hypothetical protein ABW19_dt0203714 [Dactylella cylindrospora]|nr:hypothetical protein ABW19_dt0203714 [Dactylella cylindrospora]